MLRFLDGFDHTGDPQAGWKYDEIQFRQSTIVNGRQAPGSPGGGYAYFIFNSGFTENVKTKFIGSTQTWIVGANIMVNAWSNHSGPLESLLFWRWESGASNSDGTNSHTQLVLGYDDNGNFNFIVGGQGDRFTSPLGTVVATTSVPGPNYYQIPINTWQYIEFEISFGPSGSITMWVEDVQVAQFTGLNLQRPLEPVNPDRMSLIWDNLLTIGVTIDDWYIADNTGSFNNTQLGPSRVSIVFPNLDGIAEGFTRNTGTTNFSCVHDPGGPGLGPDGTTTQVTGTGVLDLYAVPAPACFGKILGLALNACANANGGSGTLDLVCRPLSTPSLQFDLADGLALPTGYGNLSIVQAISERFPETGQNWRDGDIGQALWGMRSSSGDVSVTQVFVEKLTSLRRQTFDCGGGSYAYTR